MKHYIDKDKNIHSFEDDINEDLLNEIIEKRGLTVLTEKELKEKTSLSLDDGKKQKTNEIKKACETSILSGFKSSSLLAEHSYESSKEDQLNLSGMKDRGVPLPLKCSADNGTTWEWLEHTQEQLKTVFDDGVDFKLLQLQKAAMLKDKIHNLTTLDELELIKWEV